MKFNQLRDFIAVADNGSIRAASRALGLAQPAITRSIQELEHSLGAQLFIRGSRGVTLSPIGQKFLVRANLILEEARRSHEEVRQLSGELDGKLVIGLSPAGHMGVLSHVISPFAKRYPKVQLHIVEGFFPSCEVDMQHGLMDIYIGPLPESRPAPELSVAKLFDNELVIIGRFGNPHQEVTDLAQLKDVAWVTMSTSHDKEDITALFEEHGLARPSVIAQCQSTLSLLTMLVNSDMLATVPKEWVESPMMSNLLKPLPIKKKLSGPEMMMVHHSGLGLTPAAEYFMFLVEEVSSTICQI